jgi:diadenosine tetraphosphate (Ap4A) HIT family hydrolase
MSTLHRDRDGELIYREYLKNHGAANNICVFCDMEGGNSEILEDDSLFRVITNAFPYTLWDSCTVTEHLMVVPIRHIESVSKFTKEEAARYHEITAKYESKGYDAYARGLSSTMKSVLHQHTHLIKTDGKKIKGLVYVEEPLVHKVL